MSWATLVTAASADTATRARLLVDLLDTPDTVGLSWDAANGLPGASENIALHKMGHGRSWRCSNMA